MEKSITFRIDKKDYAKCLLVKVFNRKFFLFVFAFFLLWQILPMIKNLSASFIPNLFIIFNVNALIEALLPTLFIFVCYYFLMTFYAAFIYKRDPVLKSEITVQFNEHDLKEITAFSSYTLKYGDIYKIKLLKSVLLVYISPARLFIIPKRNEYDIKAIHAELKTLREKDGSQAAVD